MALSEEENPEEKQIQPHEPSPNIDQGELTAQKNYTRPVPQHAQNYARAIAMVCKKEDFCKQKRSSHESLSANKKGRPTKVAPGTFVGCHCHLRSICTRGTRRVGIFVATLQKYLHEHTPPYLAISKYSHWSSVEALLTTNAVFPQYRPSESHSTMPLTVSISAKIPIRRKTSGLR